MAPRAVPVVLNGKSDQRAIPQQRAQPGQRGSLWLKAGVRFPPRFAAIRHTAPVTSLRPQPSAKSY